MSIVIIILLALLIIIAMNTNEYLAICKEQIKCRVCRKKA